MARKRKQPPEDDEAIRVPPNTIEWVKWYPMRWHTSEARQTMSLTEQGLYFLLLNLCYVQGSIPADHGSLARMAGVSNAEFTHLFEKIKPSFRLDKTEQRYINPLANDVIRDTLGRISTNRINGLSGGRPRNRPDNRSVSERLTENKPIGAIRASNSYSLSSSSKKSKSSRKKTANGQALLGSDFDSQPELDAIFSEIRANHPKGRKQRPGQEREAFDGKATKLTIARKMLEHHRRECEIWANGTGCPELFRWFRNFDPDAEDLPEPPIRPNANPNRRPTTAELNEAWAAKQLEGS